MKSNLELDAQVALLCGWKKVARNGWLKWKHPSGTIMDSPPKFHADLNACAEFEAAMDRPTLEKYAAVLCEMFHDGFDPDIESVITASAQDRCKAFVKLKEATKAS